MIEPSTKILGYLLYLAAADPATFCSTATVYGEARGESELGRAMVAQVILNRVASKHYPGSVCEVVTQRKQFAGYGAALPKTEKQLARWDSIVEVVMKVEAGEYKLGSCGKATHFHSITETPHWASSLTRLCRVDNHIFYR